MSNTAVSLTVTDPSGQLWTDGYVTWQLYAKKPVFFNGVELVDDDFLPQSMELDGSGSASFSVKDNSQMTPVPQVYRVTVNPNATAEGITLYIFISGSTQNISSLVNAAIGAPNVDPIAIPFAYRDANIQLINGVGEFYYNTGSQRGFRYYDLGAWHPLGGSEVEVNGVPAPNPANFVDSSSVTWAIVGGNIEATSSGGSGITQLHGDVLAGPGSGDVAATCVMVHATNGSNLAFDIDPAEPLGLGFHFADSTHGYDTDLFSDPTTAVGPVLQFINTSAGTRTETDQISASQGLTLTCDYHAELNPGWSMFLGNPDLSSSIQLGQVDTTDLGVGVVPVGMTTSTNPLMLLVQSTGATSQDMLLSVEDVNSKATLKARFLNAINGISGGAASTGGAASSFNLGNNTVVKITGTGTINTLTGIPSFANNSYSQLVFLISVNGFSIGNSGNIASPPQITVAGNVYAAIFDGTSWWISGKGPASITDVTGSRSFGTQFQNTSSQNMQVTGYGLTSNSGTGTLTAKMGPSSASVTFWSNTNTASVTTGHAEFGFVIPPGWFYEIDAAINITGVGLWVETLLP